MTTSAEFAERAVLVQRVSTLKSLLEGDVIIGAAGAALGQRLRGSWVAEQRLLQRILAETLGDDVRATLGLWQARTEAFVARSGVEAPGWTDGEGVRWEAVTVLAILADTVERLDTWLLADTQPDDAAEP